MVNLYNPDSNMFYILQYLLKFLAIPIIILLVAYNLRRIFFSLTTLIPSKTESFQDKAHYNSSDVPDVIILVTCRDEEEMIPGLCKSLDRLDYPAARYRVVLIDDGSKDRTRTLIEENVRDRPGWHMLILGRNIGKASALNTAIDKYLFGDIIFVYDADNRPEPESLQQAAHYFDDEKVAGVSGRTIPLNPLASPIAFYSCVESHLHQMITMRAKDRLGLAPALLGSNCGYRRNHLKACGNFRKGALLEDSDLTLAFYRAGHLIRFAEDVIAYDQVPETVRGYLNQHKRWARGFNDVSQIHSAAMLLNKKLSAALRIELFMFTTGYLDRVALVGAIVLTALSFLNESLPKFPIFILLFAILAPLIQIVSFFIEQRFPISMWLRLPWMPVLLLLDIYVAITSLADTLMKRPRIWTKTERIKTEL